ncbi:response regulator [Zavarzinia sp. CC-PAN008]|uniref:response regulator n=1 Tax=Zavarzinia sp. CC-PAN008 TaxID=3243332 RepID=UPI003F743888
MARILVIDDQESVRTMVCTLLAAAGHDPVAVASGTLALRLLNRGFDLVVTDVMMPEMDGLELLRHLRARDPDLPVLVMSAGWNNPHINVLNIAAKLGAHATVPKADLREQLLHRVHDLLEARAGASA